MNNNHYIAIMAGGIGSRFWPSSTEQRPKQFLDILGVGKSLIRMTFERISTLVPTENVLIVTNKMYKDLVLEHLPELPEKNILCEPSRNNTGPCIAYTALHIQARNPNATFAVLSSDHVILKEETFLSRLKEGFDYATKNEAIVTLSIMPTRPDTGYGYIESDRSDAARIMKVKSFKEKPDIDTAKEYLKAGNYLWNSGMFVWSINTILNAFNKNAPSIIQCLSKDKTKLGTSEEQSYIDEVYPLTEKISVDYAIMEKANNVYTIPSDIGWSDLGTWNSLYNYLDKDKNHNIVQANKIHLEDVKNSLVIAQRERMVVIKGLENFIIVDEPEALLIYPKNLEQEIKSVVSKL